MLRHFSISLFPIRRCRPVANSADRNSSPYRRVLVHTLWTQLLNPARISSLIILSKQLLFPNGYPGPSPITPSRAEQIILREGLERRIKELIPGLCSTIAPRQLLLGLMETDMNCRYYRSIRTWTHTNDTTRDHPGDFGAIKLPCLQCSSCDSDIRCHFVDVISGDGHQAYHTSAGTRWRDRKRRSRNSGR